jgi:predicted nucleic acid-binding protein
MTLCFIDTNVLIYTDDKDNLAKQSTALDLIERLRISGDGVLSTQVLTEYFNGATRKLGVEAGIARRKVELFSRLKLVRIEIDLILAAIDLHRLHQFSIWDALIIKAAQAANCQELLTEDMQHRQIVDGLRIRNPFIER